MPLFLLCYFISLAENNGWLVSMCVLSLSKFRRSDQHNINTNQSLGVENLVSGLLFLVEGKCVDLCGSVVTFHCERTVGRLFAFGISILVDSIDLLKSFFIRISLIGECFVETTGSCQGYIVGF